MRSRAFAGFVFLTVLLEIAPGTPAWARAGALDHTFGGDGRVVTDFGRFNWSANAVAVQPDGRIVAGGGSSFVLARYLPDGRLDRSFGGDGRVATVAHHLDQVNDVAILPNGKILAAGVADEPTGSGTAFAMARYRPGGALDNTFGGDGVVITDFRRDVDDEIGGVVVQPDGKIVAAGWSYGRIELARYGPDGYLDRSFGDRGKVTTQFPDTEALPGIALQPDGKVVVAGSSGSSRFALARYRTNGSLDPSFGGDGKVTTPFSRWAEADAVVVQSDGRIVAAGFTGLGPVSFALARYLTDGSLDRSFGGDGRVSTPFPGGGAEAAAAALQRDGRIVAVGDTGADFALARYRSDGSLDSSFGGDGKVTTSFTPNWDLASDVAIEANGKIVAAGGAEIKPDGEKVVFAVARYLGS